MREKNLHTVIDIIVSPKSSRSKIVLDSDESLKVYLQSPPVDGKANKECIALFAKMLRVAKSNIRIIKGEKGKRKRISIDGLSRDEIYKIINVKCSKESF